MKKEFIFLISLLLILVAFPLPKKGLAANISDFSSDFSIELIPDNPLPNEQVSAKIVSYQFDINRSDIVWTLNGKVIVKGLGKKTADFSLPALGKESVLTVNIITGDGIKTSKTKRFSGSDLDFLWEALTTVPAGYKGKALAGRMAVVRITALPNLYTASGLASRSNMVYEWTMNYKNLPEESGMNKNTLLMKLNDAGDYVIGVKVSTRDKKTSFQKFLHLSAEGISPKIVFYRDEPLEGPFYGAAIGGKVFLKTNDISLRAEPFFFNEGKGQTIYKWNMNGQSVKSGKKPNIISLVSERNSGEARIGLTIEREILNDLQTAEQETNIVF